MEEGQCELNEMQGNIPAVPFNGRISFTFQLPLVQDLVVRGIGVSRRVATTIGGQLVDVDACLNCRGIAFGNPRVNVLLTGLTGVSTDLRCSSSLPLFCPVLPFPLLSTFRTGYLGLNGSIVALVSGITVNWIASQS